MNRQWIALSTLLFVSLIATADDCSGLAITNQPSAVVACPGDMAVFTIAATGNGPLTYQWRKDCFPLPGEDMDTLVIDPISASDYGTYACVVSDSCGTLTSISVRLWQGETPIYIYNSPDSTVVCDGSTAVFTVGAGGTNLAYQWRRDCAPIPGATSSTLTLTDVDASDLGQYSCVVYNNCAAVTSQAATLYIGTPAAYMLAQPSNKTVCNGANVTFSVDSYGPSPVSYQWYKDNVPISGKTQSSLTFAAQAADSGSLYSCRITHDCVVLTSSSGLLTVRVPPSITVQPVSVQACEDSEVTFSVTATGSAALSYQWFIGGSSIPGATQSTLTVTANLPNFGTYTCRVSNTCGNVTSDGAVLSLKAPVEIQTQPIGAVVCPGEDVTFSVAVTGAEPITYAWYKDSEVIPGQTGASLTLLNVSMADQASYKCRITNACGHRDSSTAALQLEVVCPASVPDPDLRSFLLSGSWEDSLGNLYPIDTDGDGITLAEAQAVTGRLDMSRLRIASLVGIGSFANLTELDASRNRLTELPPEFSNLTLLEWLDLSYNRLTAVPDLSAQTALVYLDLSHNRIGSGGSRGVGTLPSSLAELDLEANDLTSLPDLSGLVNLHRLSASYNRINQIENLLSQTSLGSNAGDVIELDHNQLEADDCASLLALQARASGAGSTLELATQLDFSSLPNWPTSNVLTFVTGREIGLTCVPP